jgi:hypothetical protein
MPVVVMPMQRILGVASPPNPLKLHVHAWRRTGRDPEWKTPSPYNEARETIGEIAEIYRARIQADVSLKPASIYYRVQTLNAILRSWPALAQLPPAKVTEDACLQWAKAYQKNG